MRGCDKMPAFAFGRMLYIRLIWSFSNPLSMNLRNDWYLVCIIVFSLSYCLSNIELSNNTSRLKRGIAVDEDSSLAQSYNRNPENGRSVQFAARMLLLESLAKWEPVLDKNGIGRWETRLWGKAGQVWGHFSHFLYLFEPNYELFRSLLSVSDVGSKEIECGLMAD